MSIVADPPLSSPCVVCLLHRVERRLIMALSLVATPYVVWTTGRILVALVGLRTEPPCFLAALFGIVASEAQEILFSRAVLTWILDIVSLCLQSPARCLGCLRSMRNWIPWETAS